MNTITSFIVSFCGRCILLGFLYMLCPSGSMSASVKYVFCLCFICCVIGSAFSIPNPDFETFDDVKSQDILTEQNVSVTAQTVFGEALKSENINFRKIVVDTNKMPDGSIVIIRVTVYTNESPQRVNEVIGSGSYEVVLVNE